PQKPVGRGQQPAPAPPADRMTADTFAGLEMRSIGPAVTSGRIVDFAVVPGHTSTYYVASASGGVWKTTNAGTSWTPVFDSEGSFSIGCVAIDPADPLTVWVGTGENNSQRSVSYGDGVYKSVDGGKSWTNVGLKDSMHIGKIVIDPRDTNVVYVAAMGPLWSPGGDRGLYKTTDGGKTWKRVLEISENTGVSDMAMVPGNPDVLYAAAYQRRRHVWTLIDGGPESAIYKSTDAGDSWKKVTRGLPNEDLGRIGLAVAPSSPDTVYAVVEAANDAGGFFRSRDRGENWEKMSKYVSGGPQYYQELFVDPREASRIYSMDVYLMVSDDAGKTFHHAGERYKHVDNHALWIDPDNTDHLLNGNDGGVYETFDRGATWDFKANLPVTQFYRVATDNAVPFYSVYGGTQDNFSLGGPSRTASQNGISNDLWFVTVGGDGFQSRVDPEDPNTVYAESQYGVLARFDRRTGEQVDIQPQPGPGEPPLRWNWDSPITISPHSHTRLYFAAQRVFRSDDRGNTWKAISGDLTRQIDRNKLKVMGRVWGPDAVAKNSSTSFYGNIVSLAESPVKENLLYAGTDDGLIQVTEDGGATWRRIERVPGVPPDTYVSRLEPSPTDANVVYAAFDNHKMGDLKPYLFKSSDRGATWTSIAGNLPERGSVYVVVEDPGKRDLLFAGTEFGLFFSVDGGRRWTRIKGNFPTIAVRDITIQRRENDLVVATFGRGFYILDDYTPLRLVTPALVDAEATFFPVKSAWMYMESSPLGLRESGFLGESHYRAPNPPFGAIFTYYLRDGLKTRKQVRREQEQKIEKQGGDVFYPSWDELRAEANEEAPAIVLVVSDEAGNIVRRLTGPSTAGFHRVAWDLRFPASDPGDTPAPDPADMFSSPPAGPMAAPGSYNVALFKRVEGKLVPLGQPQTFTTKPLGTATLGAGDRAAALQFEQKVARLQRAVLGAAAVVRDSEKQLSLARKAIDDAPRADAGLMEQVRALQARLRDIDVALNGDRVVAKYNEPTPPSIVDRVQLVVGGTWNITSAATDTHRRSYDIAAKAFAPVLDNLRKLVEVDMKTLADRMEAVGAPWTPGRVPRWNPE
ncbi:MAG: hypothetical protein ACM3NQ_22425, partial [Bacteroidales bacterium]